MIQRVTALHNELRDALYALDPEAVPLREVTTLWQLLDATERLVAGAKTLLARRVEDAGAWERAGYRSAAEALAAAAGTTVAAARGVLETSKRLADLPDTAAAVRAGELSVPKAEAIVAAATVDPSAEVQLLATAANATLADVRRACVRVKVAAKGDAMYERIRRERRLREYTDGEGAWNLVARGMPEAGAEVRATLDSIVDELFETARRTGEHQHEHRDAYAFDALVEMARRARCERSAGEPGARRKHTRKPLALLRIDVEALRRGSVEGDELCEIAGLGPIPVRVARDLLGDAIVKLVITKGTDVCHVTHLGRGATAGQRAALLWQSPGCRVEGCTRTRVEIDHRVDWARTRHTRLDELDPLCAHHHALKTRHHWALVDGIGDRPIVPPSDPRHPRNRPPPDP